MNYIRSHFAVLVVASSLLTLPAVVQAQFNYTTNSRTITITKYTGPGGDVVIPDTINGLPVTSIGGVLLPPEGAFYGCTSLTSVTIPDSVTGIGNWAFYGCTGLTNVTIGKNLISSIGYPAPGGYYGYIFQGCTNLTTITVHPDNPVYSSVDGVLFNKNQTSLIRCPWGRGGAYTVPDGVTSIWRSAFENCTSLTSVTVPNSVTSIGSCAFCDCTGLTSITVPNSVVSIGEMAFYGCKGLTSVTIPDGVVSIAGMAFACCYSLTNVVIGTGVTSIETETFDGCKGLTSVTIGNGVTNIGDGAFLSCNSLTNITIPESVVSIGGSAFAGSSLSGIYFLGDATGLHAEKMFWFAGILRPDHVTVYYLPGTTGWGPTFDGCPTALWHLPVADASATESWLLSANGLNATAILNGSRSYDLDGGTLQYSWFSSGSLLANGVMAETVLPVGTHAINLVVSDGIATSTNSVSVSVVTTGQAVQMLLGLVNGSTVGKSKPLTASLTAALGSIERGNRGAAANQLRAFQNKVQAQIADEALAREFIEAAQQVIEAL
jgi:hypothetical protein